MSSFFRFFGCFRKNSKVVRLRVISWKDLDQVLTVSILEPPRRICPAKISNIIEEGGLRFVVLRLFAKDGKEKVEAFPWEKVLVVEEGK